MSLDGHQTAVPPHSRLPRPGLATSFRRTAQRAFVVSAPAAALRALAHGGRVDPPLRISWDQRRVDRLPWDYALVTVELTGGSPAARRRLIDELLRSRARAPRHQRFIVANQGAVVTRNELTLGMRQEIVNSAYAKQVICACLELANEAQAADARIVKEC